MTEPAVARKEHKRVNLGSLRQWISTIIITVSYLILGTSIGWPSPTLYELHETGKPVNLTSGDTAVMVSLFYVGNIVMSIPSGALIDHFGRRNCLLPLSVLPVSSWILIYFAFDSTMIYVARLLAGFWSGLVLTGVPLYIAEITEPRVRGAMSSLAQTLINVGVVFVYALAPLVSYWTLAIACGAIPICFFFLLSFIPESPHWLVYKGLHDKAAVSLAWLRGSKTEDVREEMDVLIAAVNADAVRSRGVLMLVKSKGLRKALMIVEVLAISQRLSGITNLMAYMSVTLPDIKVGILRVSDCVLLVGLVWCASVVTTVPLVDRLGRVPLLLVSSAGCCLSMLAAAVWFSYSQATQSDFLHWVPFASFFVHGWFFNMGLGPLATTLQSEMFPSNMKAVASGITVIVLALASALVNSTYLLIAENVGMFMNYYIYTTSCLLCFIFVYFCVIETKGKSLHQIQQELHRDEELNEDHF